MNLIRLFIISVFLITGCSDKQAGLSRAAPPEQVDFACSSFYFLWGTHAEYAERYPEALEAYEKALICDPEATYIEEKLPILMLKMGEYQAAATWLTDALAKNPNNTTYLLFLGNIFVQEDKIEDAVRLYEEILELEPDNEAVTSRLGILYTHLGQYDTAEQIFRDLLTRKPHSYFTCLSLARLLSQENEYDEAALLYEKALSLNWSKELAFEVGYLYSNQQEQEKALRVYTTITDNDPFDERAWLSRIQTLLDLNRFTEADTELRSVRLFSQEPEKIDLILSKVYLQQGKTTEAKDILERLDKEPEAYEARYMLALLAYRQEHYSKSLGYVDRIPEGSNNFEEAVYLKVKILQKQQKADSAVTLLQSYIENEKSSSPLFYALLSSLHTDQQNKDLALTTLQKGVIAYPENYQLHFELGLLLEKYNRNKEAVIQMQKVLDLQPDHADALNFIGYSWADKNIRLDEALGYILRALEIKPANGFIMDSLGWVYFRLGRFNEAVETLKEATILEPGDPHIVEHLGDAHKALGNYNDAVKAYEKAYELFENKYKKSAVKVKIDAIKDKSPLLTHHPILFPAPVSVSLFRLCPETLGHFSWRRGV